MNLSKSDIFRTIRIIRSVRCYQESLWWELPVLLSSCLKDFRNDNGTTDFADFTEIFSFYRSLCRWICCCFLLFVLFCFVICFVCLFFSVPLSLLSSLGRCFCCFFVFVVVFLFVFVFCFAVFFGCFSCASQLVI